MLMEHCLSDERGYMDTSDDLFILYFYLHLPTIYDLGVMVSFTTFETEFLTALNVAPSRITLNVWEIPKDFHIMYYTLHHVSLPTVNFVGGSAGGVLFGGKSADGKVCQDPGENEVQGFQHEQAYLGGWGGVEVDKGKEG
ncbi:hypothetical protein KIW84_064223 [Lathyrus oleraceus]|uniref:Uncharacterized protein n=1 Tax=Pisum sativum TaxID=3888 RepID=A0A9D4WDS0_PEA|nr:hypothetical protein KIW84_064223 [Pisum sativum]